MFRNSKCSAALITSQKANIGKGWETNFSKTETPETKRWGNKKHPLIFFFAIHDKNFLCGRGYIDKQIPKYDYSHAFKNFKVSYICPKNASVESYKFKTGIRFEQVCEPQIY